MKEVEHIIRSGSKIENCSLLAASACASTHIKPKSTQAIEFESPVQQALNDKKK
jgi:hypothetical protein